jgi:UDP:flavonoid glycosyltransferase YjiC (YdhE family)
MLVTTCAEYGHLHPVVPLAAAARHRGDEVRIATGRDLAAWVRSCGFEFEAAGLSQREALAPRQSFPPGERIARNFTTVRVPPMLRDLLRLCEEWRPDLIVHDEGESTAPLLAALLGIPCVTHSFASPARPRAEREVVRSFLEPIWAEHHVGPARVSGDIYLDACPPAFQTEDIASIPGVRSIRPVAFDGPPVVAPPRVVGARRPAAYVSFGTVPVFSRPEVLRKTVDAISTVVASVTVTTGPNPAEVLDQANPRVFVQQYLQQSAILPHVDVIVSHGGAGTTLGALLHGLPHVVVPQQKMSQLRNALRIEALGVGIHVSYDAPPDASARAVRAILDDPSFGRRAAAMGAALAELPSPEAVLDAVTTSLL